METLSPENWQNLYLPLGKTLMLALVVGTLCGGPFWQSERGNVWMIYWQVSPQNNVLVLEEVRRGGNNSVVHLQKKGCQLKRFSKCMCNSVKLLRGCTFQQVWWHCWEALSGGDSKGVWLLIQYTWLWGSSKGVVPVHMTYIWQKLEPFTQHSESTRYLGPCIPCKLLSVAGSLAEQL